MDKMNVCRFLLNILSFNINIQIYYNVMALTFEGKAKKKVDVKNVINNYMHTRNIIKCCLWNLCVYSYVTCILFATKLIKCFF